MNPSVYILFFLLNSLSIGSNGRIGVIFALARNGKT